MSRRSARTRGLVRLAGGVALVAGLLLAPNAAQAATFTVTKTADTADGTCDADCSLREAISAANASAGTDTIVVPAGTYVRTLTGSDDTNALGDLDVNEAATILGAGAGATVIEGNGTTAGDRVLDLDDGGIHIAGVTIRNGYASSNGGGIDAHNEAVLALEASVVTSNKADGDGGGLNIDGGALLTDVTISSNTADADASGGGDGGGIYVDGNGGPIFRGVTMTGNSTINDGGAIYNDDVLDLTNVTISGNTAGESGGGIYNAYAVSMNNVTIAANTGDGDNTGLGDEGGGLYNEEAGVLVRNTIIANNADPSGGGPDCFTETGGPLLSRGHNLLRNATGCSGMIGTGDILGADPKLGPLADNGGPTQTMALLKGSPAINAGDPSKPGSKGTAACAVDDQRGAPRNCDIGAYEYVTCGGVLVNEVLTGGNDVFKGTSATEGVLGLDGNDRINGSGGKDGLCGGDGKDKLNGAAGNDRLDGGDGKDLCIGGAGKDKAAVSCEKTKKVP